MPSSDNYLEDYHLAVEEVDAAEIAESAEEEEQHWAAALRHAEKCIATLPDDPQYNYLIGYVYSRTMKDVEMARSRAIVHLQKTLKISPQHAWARYCLVVVYFWRRRFGDALQTGSRLRQTDFERLGQEWRNIMLLEILFCCQWQLGMPEATLDALQEICFLHVNHESELPGYPSALFETATELLERMPTGHRTKFLERIKHTVGQLDIADYVETKYPELYRWIDL